MDYFCAIYSVINALRLTHGISLAESRDILGTALREISAIPHLWEALLENQTDHHWVVRYMLGRFCATGNRKLRVARLPLSYADVLSAGSATLPGRHGQAANAMQPGARLDHLLSDGSGHAEAPGFNPAMAVASGSLQEGAATLAPGKPDGLTAEQICRRLPFAAPEPLSLGSLRDDALYDARVELGRMAAPSLYPPRRKRGWKIETLWPLLQYWLPSRGLLSAFGNISKQNRCLLLRFHRFLPNQQFPLISHWSTGREFGKDTLMLYDCTANKDAIHALPLPDCSLYPENVSPDRLLALELESVYFLEKI